jgi:3-hydroxymyristoyl/3-hydroxydecanoyl-(acyl carrier protein) dehydratase
MAADAHSAEYVVEPIVVARRVAAPVAEIEVVVPSDLRYFDGHFPGAPVVPGVVQIKWALELARRYLDVGGGFAGLERLKFQQLMTPGTRATLTLQHEASAHKVQFSFASASADARYSSGRLLLRAPQ